jgi:hypothetical protein
LINFLYGLTSGYENAITANRRHIFWENYLHVGMLNMCFAAILFFIIVACIGIILFLRTLKFKNNNV